MRGRRAAMVAALEDGPLLRRVYGIEVTVRPEEVTLAIEDSTGDHLDALFSAVQAAWASLQTPERLGTGDSTVASEGWIADPALALPDRAAPSAPRAPAGAGRGA